MQKIFTKTLSLITIISLFALTTPVHADVGTGGGAPMPIPEIEGLVIPQEPLEIPAPYITINPFDAITPAITLTVTATSNARFTVEGSETMVDNGDGTFTASYTFIENGVHTFRVTDVLNQTATETVEVTNIDNIGPAIDTLEYNTNPTNQNIVVTAVTDPDAHFTTPNPLTITENGAYDFFAQDVAGNESSYTIHITNIDKTAPTITVAPYTTTDTTGPITVTATTDEDATLAETSHTFTTNGTFTFVATDLAGNITSRDVVITNIRTATNSGGNGGSSGGGSSSGGTMDYCSNLPGIQTTIPEGYTVSAFRTCTPANSVTTTTTNSTTSTAGQVLGASDFKFTLEMKFGDRNDEVKELQDRLVADGYMTGPSTGYFWFKTIKAVRAFQKAHGIVPTTGNVGPLTLAALNK